MSDLTPAQLAHALRGRYSVDREIAEGGMATVYLAQDIRHGRRVALKLMKAGATEGGSQRFLREIGVTARLAHPHILPLLDSGDVDGLPFYVMPFVEGETLKDRMTREGRLAVDDAVHLAAEIADALAYAHAQGIVHRDIKPANILLSGRHALVADFGVAKALATPSADEVTQAGLAVGTVAYMSPEQAVGEPTIDGRSDIFSLGIVLFEMLVGEKAFGGRTVQEQLAKRFSGVVPSARARRAEIAEGLDSVIARALATEPGHRFATAGEFETALVAASRGHAAPFATGVIHIAREPDAVPSIAVLPLDNHGGDADNEYLADGLAEEVLTRLARRRTVRVCARVSSFAQRGSTDDARTIGARLGVRHLLTGSVRRAGDRLRVTVQLVDSTTGFETWSERYDRQVTDLFAIQDEIGAAITGALHATLLGEESPRPARAPRFEAYEQLLKGRHLWNRRTAATTERAIACFREALALDPEYAAAWAALADAQVTRAIYGAVDPAEGMQAARDAAVAALAIDPSLAEARAALAQVEAAHDWQWAAAEARFREAIALNPQLPSAYQGLAILTLTPRAQHADARVAVDRALALDPLSPALRATSASVHLYARRHEDARATAASILELEPDFAPAYFFAAQAADAMGDVGGARLHAERAVELSGRSSESLAVLGMVRAHAGDRDGAAAALAELGGDAGPAHRWPSQAAVIHAALGELDAACDMLGFAVQRRAPDLAWLAVRPAWAPLREHPAYQALLRQLHLAP